VIKWSEVQKQHLWSLYVNGARLEDMAKHYPMAFASVRDMQDLIAQMHRERDEQVERDIEMAKRRDYSYATRSDYLKERKARDLKKPRRNPPLTQEEIEKLKEVRK